MRRICGFALYSLFIHNSHHLKYWLIDTRSLTQQLVYNYAFWYKNYTGIPHQNAPVVLAFCCFSQDIMDYVLVRVPPPTPGLPKPRFSLYLSSQLQYGVVVVYHRQCGFLLGE